MHLHLLELRNTQSQRWRPVLLHKGIEKQTLLTMVALKRTTALTSLRREAAVRRRVRHRCVRTDRNDCTLSAAPQ